MKNFIVLFLLLALLVGCGRADFTQDKLKTANSACEANGGFIKVTPYAEDGPGQIRCANGARFYFDKSGVLPL